MLGKVGDVTSDEAVAPVMCDFMPETEIFAPEAEIIAPEAEIIAAGTPNGLVASGSPVKMARPSSFVRDGVSVSRTYSAYDGGIDQVSRVRSLLGLSAIGVSRPRGEPTGNAEDAPASPERGSSSAATHVDTGG